MGYGITHAYISTQTNTIGLKIIFERSYIIVYK